jgi:NADPH:quinone reductase-like Zn-dependent oxidoreductase
MAEKSTWALLSLVNKASKLIANRTIHSEVAKRVSLSEVREAIPEYKKNMTAGKYLVYPQQE